MGLQWVHRRWVPHCLRHLGDEFLWGWNKRLSRSSAFPRSVLNLPRLPTQHHAHRRSIHPQASSPDDRATQERRHNNFVVLVHASSECLMPLISLHSKERLNLLNPSRVIKHFFFHRQSFWPFSLFTIKGTLKRRDHLNESKFFWCTCERCKDPTELGTHASTLLCPKCSNGFILSTEPLNQDADWK